MASTSEEEEEMSVDGGSSSEEEEEESSSEGSPTPPPRQLPSRATRGLRMTQVREQAQLADRRFFSCARESRGR